MTKEQELKVIELMQSGHFNPNHITKIICAGIPCAVCDAAEVCCFEIQHEKFYDEFMSEHPEHKI